MWVVHARQSKAGLLGLEIYQNLVSIVTSFWNLQIPLPQRMNCHGSKIFLIFLEAEMRSEKSVRFQHLGTPFLALFFLEDLETCQQTPGWLIHNQLAKLIEIKETYTPEI